MDHWGENYFCQLFTELNILSVCHYSLYIVKHFFFFQLVQINTKVRGIVVEEVRSLPFKICVQHRFTEVKYYTFSEMFSSYSGLGSFTHLILEIITRQEARPRWVLMKKHCGEDFVYQEEDKLYDSGRDSSRTWRKTAEEMAFGHGGRFRKRWLEDMEDAKRDSSLTPVRWF